MSWCKKKFWIENTSELFCNFQIIPTPSMSLEEQMNAFTRFIIIIFLLMLIFMSKPQISFIFLFLSLLFIIILYYIQKRTMEYYKPSCASCGNTGKCRQNCGLTTIPLNTASLTKKVGGSSIIQRPQHTLFCNDEQPLTPNDPNYVSLNQRLAGPPNPKTQIAPVVVPPLSDLDYWRANNLINHSHINTESQFDTYLSGYDVSNCCDRINACITPVKNSQQNVIEGFENGPTYEGISDSCRPAQAKCNPLQQTAHPIVSPQPATTIPVIRRTNQDFTERYTAGLAESAIRAEGSKGCYEGFTCSEGRDARDPLPPHHLQQIKDRKSTRLNSSHQIISYAVFCLKKKKRKKKKKKNNHTYTHISNRKNK